jgi:large subunit ribosomal protein L23
MGLLDRWIKRKTEEQLKKEVAPKSEEKKTTPALSTVPKTNTVSTKVSTKKKTVVEDKKVVKEASVSNSSKGSDSEFARKIIIRPITTEKTTYLESENKYVFLVAKDSTKHDIKKAVKELYNVSPLAVQVIHVQGKRVRFGRMQGHRSDYKKAIVTVSGESTIKLHETV